MVMLHVLKFDLEDCHIYRKSDKLMQQNMIYLGKCIDVEI